MRRAAVGVMVSAGVLVIAAGSAAASAQPPMGQFDGAFYTCDQGQAFQIGYDSRSPTKATLTTSNNNARYALKRADGAGGPQFSNGTVNITLVGDQATVAGTALKLTGCKLKNTT